MTSGIHARRSRWSLMKHRIHQPIRASMNHADTELESFHMGDVLLGSDDLLNYLLGGDESPYRARCLSEFPGKGVRGWCMADYHNDEEPASRQGWVHNESHSSLDELSSVFPFHLDSVGLHLHPKSVHNQLCRWRRARSNNQRPSGPSARSGVLAVHVSQPCFTG